MAKSNTYKIEAQTDFLLKQAHARPVTALAELIWNAFDADASSIDVRYEPSTLGGMSKIVVEDDGHGIPFADAPKLFQRLGGSWKRTGMKSSAKGRFLHGSEGKGRFKAFSLGRAVDWTVVYERDETLMEFRISMLSDNPKEVSITEEHHSNADHPGVIVEISELDRDFPSLDPTRSETIIQQLTQVFAIKLIDYTDVQISIQQKKLDPKSVIRERSNYTLTNIFSEGIEYDSNIEIIEWSDVGEKTLYLCNEHGFPLVEAQNRIRTGDHQFSAYLKSNYIDTLNNQGTLELAGLNPALQKSCNEAANLISEHFTAKDEELARNIVERWKSDYIYPYSGEAKNPIEAAERQVFDLIAVKVSNNLPDFEASEPKNKRFQLRLLRQVIAQSPDDLKKIMTEVLDLSARDQQVFARILKETRLSSIISAAKVVADRLKFIVGLEALLFDQDFKKNLKERRELHRILAENTWFFGEEFNLVADDQVLTKVLRKLAKIHKKNIRIDEPVLRSNGKTGIIDLMFSKEIRRDSEDEREHLVVELKAPKVKITMAELSQIQQYAMAIADDERFQSLSTRWNFWVISNEIDSTVQRLGRQFGLPPGVVFRSDDGFITVWVKTWAQILQENKSRHRFFQERFEYKVDKIDALKHLKENYGKIINQKNIS